MESIDFNCKESWTLFALENSILECYYCLLIRNIKKDKHGITSRRAVFSLVICITVNISVYFYINFCNFEKRSFL